MTALKDIEDSIRYSCRKMPDYGDALIKKVDTLFEQKEKLSKLEHERYSLWIKLLNENPSDVTNSLRMEFGVLLKTLGIIDEIPKLTGVAEQ